MIRMMIMMIILYILNMSFAPRTEKLKIEKKFQIKYLVFGGCPVNLKSISRKRVFFFAH